jgi:hypothetical protein
MSDLQNMLTMLSNSTDEFSKEKSGADWKISVTNRLVVIYFDEDGKYKFMSSIR